MFLTLSDRLKGIRELRIDNCSRTTGIDADLSRIPEATCRNGRRGASPSPEGWGWSFVRTMSGLDNGSVRDILDRVMRRLWSIICKMAMQSITRRKFGLIIKACGDRVLEHVMRMVCRSRSVFGSKICHVRSIFVFYTRRGARVLVIRVRIVSSLIF